MAQQSKPQYQFHYQRVELLKTEELGIGSYGAVYKAMCDDLPCAAKILHPTLFQFTAPGTTNVMRNFQQECRLLSNIKHPHIVQYLGTYQDPESRLPVLLMELMDESLTRFLERSHEPLPYHTEVNLCHDITLALSYLHSNGIVHRDLSSNNVLLIAGSRAKVTDFGMVKLYDVNRSTAHFTPLTICPGTMAYMPPEALRDHPVYTDKLDSFSLGVLSVQIMTRQFPNPGDRFQVMVINDPRIPSGRVQVEVPEIERRQSHLDLIDPTHPLLPLALDCIKDRDRERPSCHELCGRLSTLKAFSKYTESVQQSQVTTTPTQSANRESRERERQQPRQIRDLQQQLHTQSNQLQVKEQENQQQQQQILGLQTLLTTKDDQLAGKAHQLQQKEAAISTSQQEIQQLRQQLQSSEEVTVQFQQNLLEGDKMIQGLQRQVLELQQQLRIKLWWRYGQSAPCKMSGEVSAVGGSVAYFQPGLPKSVFGYNSSTKKWSELPQCPNSGFSLAMVNSVLTAIGGEISYNEATNSLLSLTDNKWTEQFPPMPTKRWWTAAVCSGRSLVVAGGVCRYETLSTVEVMDTETLQWSTASSLPHPLRKASATLCGDQVYMLGGYDQKNKTSKSVFTCSLADLLQSLQPQSPVAQRSLVAQQRSSSLAFRGEYPYKLEVMHRRRRFAPQEIGEHWYRSEAWHPPPAALLQFCQPQSLGGQLKTSSLDSGPKVWYRVADTPVILSTCTSLDGRLLAVGGEDLHCEKTTAIHMFNTTTNCWEVISHMTLSRSQCLVAVLPHNQLMVVGGYITYYGGFTGLTCTDFVEIATII